MVAEWANIKDPATGKWRRFTEKEFQRYRNGKRDVFETEASITKAIDGKTGMVTTVKRTVHGKEVKPGQDKKSFVKMARNISIVPIWGKREEGWEDKLLVEFSAIDHGIGLNTFPVECQFVKIHAVE